MKPLAMPTDKKDLIYLSNSLAEYNRDDIEPNLRIWYESAGVDSFNARLYLVEFYGIPGILADYEMCDEDHCSDAGMDRATLFRLLCENAERLSEQPPYCYFQLLTGKQTGPFENDEIAIFFPYPTPAQTVRAVLKRSDEEIYHIEGETEPLAPQKEPRDSLYRIFLTKTSDAAEIDDLEHLQDQLQDMGLQVKEIKSVHSYPQLLGEMPDVVPDLADYVRNTLMEHEDIAPVWNDLDNEHVIIEAAIGAAQSDKVTTLVRHVREAIEDYTDKATAEFLALALIEWVYDRM